MTEVFVVLVEDRHDDVGVDVFTDELDAIDYAIRQVPESCHAYADFSHGLSRPMVADGWVRYIPYGNEGECVRVMRRELDKEKKS